MTGGAAVGNGWRSRAAPAAVYRQYGAGDEPGFVAAQVDGRLGAVLGPARPAGKRLPGAQERGDVRVVNGPGGHRRVDQAGGEDVDADAVAGVAGRGVAAEGDDAALGRR